jgi:hypothetical protein
MHTIFWLEHLNGRDRSKNQGVEGDIIQIDLKEVGWKFCIGCIWLWIGTSDVLL